MAIEVAMSVELDEGQLLARARRGDEQAYAELVTRHADAMYRVVAGHIGEGEAEDAVQEVFLRFHRALGRFRGQSTLRTYLYRIATNVALERLRRRRRRGWLTLLGEREPAARGGGPVGALVADERRQAIQAAVAGLPAHQRAVLVLRAYEGLSFEEVARVLEIKRPTAESRMARARATLRKELGAWLGGAEAGR